MDRLQLFCLTFMSFIYTGFKLVEADDYSIYPDKDCHGNDFLGGYSLEHLSECQAICDRHAECVAFAYKDTSIEHSCWPKNACNGLSTNYEGWTTFMKISESSSAGSGDNGDDEDDSENEEEDDGYIKAGGCKFSLDPHHALYGHNDEYLESLSLEECLDTCAKSEACLSIDRNIESGNCIISYSSRTTNPDAYGRHGRVNYYQKEDCEVENLPEDEEIIGGKCIKTFGPFGNSGGDAFSDKDLFLQNLGSISKIEINHGFYINCISFTYGRKGEAQNGPCRGTQPGTTDIIELKKREYITDIQGMAGDLIDQLTLTTNLQTYGPYGIEGGSPFAVASGGRRLAFISGRAGRFVDELSFHYYC